MAINFATSSIELNGKSHKIQTYTVYFQVMGIGLVSSIEEALKHKRPFATIPVAVAEDEFYECLPAEMDPNA